MKCNAVFEGGGVKGIAFIGAIQETERRGYTFECLAGTSAGALIASLLAAGYTGHDLEKYIEELSLASFLDPSLLAKIPYIGMGLSILWSNGIYRGDALENWIAHMLAEKGIYTFADLPKNKLKIIASDISRGKILILPDDVKEYNLDPKGFSVSKAVRMSCSIPYFFQPVKLGSLNQKSYIVDGSLLSNYPVWLFDTKTRPPWPTIGFRLRGATKEETPTSIHGPISMLSAMVSTMLEAHDRLFIKQKDAARTIFIPVENVKVTDFQMSRKQKENLIKLGKEETNQFFTKWSFFNYLQRYSPEMLMA